MKKDSVTPNLLPDTRILCDTHVHTVASGHAFSTVTEISKEASEKGLGLVAITDHGPALPGGAHLYHFFNLRVLPKVMNGVRILKGAEANIISPDGKIDLDEQVISELDIILVALHWNTGMDGATKEVLTDALIKSMEKYPIKVLAHLGNPLFPLDFDKVVKRAKELNVAIEFNNSSYLSTTSRSGSYELDVELASFVKQHGAQVVIGSDAHIAQDVGRFDSAIELIERAGIDEERILCTSVEKLLDFLRK